MGIVNNQVCYKLFHSNNGKCKLVISQVTQVTQQSLNVVHSQHLKRQTAVSDCSWFRLACISLLFGIIFSTYGKESSIQICCVVNKSKTTLHVKSAIKCFLALTEPNRTSRKSPPKLQRLSGRLREVVVYKNRTTGVSSEKRSGNIYFMEDNFVNAT